MDPTAFNYNPFATCDDGSCVPVLYGCIDSTAFNYNPLANINDGSCLTYVPDNNFEAYLEANGMGNGIANDDLVTTANIINVIQLNINNLNISDLTGIEDFTSLTTLLCYNNLLTSLDVSQNTNLIHFECHNNLLTSLDLRNGNNTNFSYCAANNNSDLHCINVDNPAYSNANWPLGNNFDPQQYFSNNCPIGNINCSDSLVITDVIINNNNFTMNITK